LRTFGEGCPKALEVIQSQLTRLTMPRSQVGTPPTGVYQIEAVGSVEQVQQFLQIITARGYKLTDEGYTQDLVRVFNCREILTLFSSLSH
jgi:hypothetical protein